MQLFAEDGEEPSPLDVRRCKRRETILILQLALAAIRETIGQRQELARDLAQVEHVYNRISARQILGKDAQKEALEMMTVTLFDFGELKGALDVYQSWVMRSTMEMREG